MALIFSFSSENYTLYKNCYSLALKSNDSPGTDVMMQIFGILENVGKALNFESV